MNIGTLFAIGALFGWAFGDFYIQKTIRKVGNIRALFYIAAFGSIILTPFIWNEIFPTIQDIRHWPIIIIACLLALGTSLANFQGLKLGKLAVVVPINGIEIVIAVGLAMLIGQERYSKSTYIFIFLVMIGLSLTCIASFNKLKKLKLEKGVRWAFVGAIGLGACNFIVGYTSQILSPLMAIWLTHTAVAIGTAALMFKQKLFNLVIQDFKKFINIIYLQTLLDNAAWISYAYATIYIPIGIATTISEGYLIIAVLLGLIVNKEKVKPHQILGMIMALLGILALSTIAT